VLRNPILFLLLILIAGGTYVAYSLNLLGPMMQMSSAAWGQGVEIGKQKLREFLENNETARAAIAMPARRDTDSISLDTLDSRGKKAERRANGGSAANDDDDI
jgi:protein SEY1